jgi:exonuclease SbcD
VKIAHFSDLHYSARNLAEADRCFSAAVERAIELRVDAAVVTGDATDHALDLHSPAAERLARRIGRLAEHCPVLMLQGTYAHEPPGTLSIFRLIGGRFPVHVADRIEQIALDGAGRGQASAGWCFDTVPANASVVFTCVPTVNRAAVASAVGAAEAAGAIGEQLARLLRGFAATNRRARDAGIATVGLSHGTVLGSITEHGVPMAGFDHEFTAAALFGAGAEVFMLGHIHRHQSWQQGEQCIAYAGSIGRFHYGEQGEKGFLAWYIEPGRTRCMLQPTPARRTLDIVFDGKPDLAQIEAAAAAHDLAGAYVRVRWSVPDEDRHEVDRRAIERILAAAAEVKLEGRLLPVVRTRAVGIGQAGSVAAQVAAWARVTQTRDAPLLERLAMLAGQSPEQIAAAVLAHEHEPALDATPLAARDFEWSPR